MLNCHLAEMMIIPDVRLRRKSWLTSLPILCQSKPKPYFSNSETKWWFLGKLQPKPNLENLFCIPLITDQHFYRLDLFLGDQPLMVSELKANRCVNIGSKFPAAV